MNDLDNALNFTMYSLTDMATKPCVGIILCCLILHFFLTYARTYLTSSDLSIDFTPMLRCVAVGFFVAFYSSLMPLIAAGVQSITGYFSKVPDVLEALNNITEAMAKNPNTSTRFEGTFFSEEFTLPFNDGKTFITYITLCIEQGLTMIVRLFVERVRSILFAFLFAVGPLALALSCIPSLSGIAIHWFKTWLSVALWTVTLAVIDNLVIVMQNQIIKQVGAATDGTAFTMDVVCINLVFIVMYFSIPILTTYYVGGSGGGAFMARTSGAFMGVGNSLNQWTNTKLRQLKSNSGSYSKTRNQTS
jgi:hypothetical protein